MSNVLLRDVCKSYGTIRALRDLNLACNNGELLVVFGPSGAGKTTLLKLVAGFETQDSGQILLDSQEVAGVATEHRDVAMAFETYALYPHMTVRQNLEFPLRSPERRLGAAERKIRLETVAALLEIDPLLDRRPGELSGGQRQRVSLGRALVRKARATLLDEPMAHLDARLRHNLRAELRHFLTTQGATTIYATPDFAEAFGIADRVAVLVDGCVEQIGTPAEVFDTPATVRAAELIGDPRMNVLSLSDGNRLVFGEQQIDIGRLATRGSGPDLKHVGLQPEDIVMADPSAPDVVRGQVYVVEPAGISQVVKVRSAGRTLTMKVAGSTSVPAIGRPIAVRFDWTRAHLFDSRGIRISQAIG
jgi:multiple sugar transport system ATP-binding protein